MPPVPLIDPQSLDFRNVQADRERIRAANPQRFEMEQLTAVVHLDLENNLIVGYKDVGHDEFWVRGHLPGFPLMPGVVICEAAAQLVSYLSRAKNLLDDGFMGFGGMDEVRFRGMVKPGDRLVLVGKATKLNRRQTVFETQGFVNGNMVFQARIMGVPLRPVEAAPAQTASPSESESESPPPAAVNTPAAV